MKSSIAVQAFKGIISRIHPQLPLSAKESQRLLNALTSSFNHHLESEHPAPNSKHTSHPPPPSPREGHSLSQTSASSQSTALPSSSSSSSSRNTDIHLASILTNPLFGRPAQRPSTSNAALSQLKTKAKHPVQVFEDAVARGQATIEIARLCLSAFRTSLKALPSSERQSHLQDMAAGTRVLRWLWSSGKIHAYAFSDDRRFLDTLSYFLVAEANESALWDLIDTSSREVYTKESQVPAPDIRRRKGLILCSLVKAHLAIIESTPSAAFTAALSTFLRAFDTNSSSPSSLPRPSLAAAGALLSKKLASFEIATTAHPAPADLYDRFIETCPLWDKSPSDRALYRVATLKLHHPASPSARDAMYFIRHLKQSPKHPFLAPSTEAQKADVFGFFFDTVHLLQAQAFQDDAAWVMEFMQRAFPQHFVEQNSALKSAESRAIQPNASAPSVSQVADPMLSAWRLPDVG